MITDNRCQPIIQKHPAMDAFFEKIQTKPHN
jgi:hypothetical protein